MGAAEPTWPGAIDQVIIPRTSDLGGFEVARVLPFRKKRMVGPFVFLDQMGPHLFAPNTGLDVAPHPHIGLATVTYLYEGEIFHRDSLGNALAIKPGAVNWMTAGRGIVHSERTPTDMRARGGRLSGMQAWVALPERFEEMAPAFVHHDADSLLQVDEAGVHIRLLAGSFAGLRSPVETLSETLYVDIQLEPDARLAVEARYEERALHIAEGTITLDGQCFEAGRMLVLKPGAALTLCAQTPARLLLLGGEPLGGPRHIWWNFVSSRKERIEQAKEDWTHGRFAAVPGEGDAFIPLPA
jgi:redox-sensitive bicupin YhaK (pirin superfamily)